MVVVVVSSVGEKSGSSSSSSSSSSRLDINGAGCEAGAMTGVVSVVWGGGGDCRGQ
jgi:hypothetical protein